MIALLYYFNKWTHREQHKMLNLWVNGLVNAKSSLSKICKKHFKARWFTCFSKTGKNKMWSRLIQSTAEMESSKLSLLTTKQLSNSTDNATLVKRSSLDHSTCTLILLLQKVKWRNTISKELLKKIRKNSSKQLTMTLVYAKFTQVMDLSQELN